MDFAKLEKAAPFVCAVRGAVWSVDESQATRDRKAESVPLDGWDETVIVL